MSSELERRLAGVFAEAPGARSGSGGEGAAPCAACAAAAVAAPRRGLRAAVLAFAAAVVLLVIAAGSLAAAGALHVSFGAKPKPHPATTQLVLPQGANGVAAIVDGRLSVVTKDGLGLEGQTVSAAALSPRALYVAAGIGNSLVAMAPNGRRAWSHPAGGKVVAIAWAPDGFRIAYIVHAGHRFVLHVIYGNGIDDTTIDRSVRAVRPSWRGNSLAFAYVGGGGRAIVYDVGHESRHVVAVRPPVTGLAFAPSGDALALEGPSGVSLVEQSASRHITAPEVEAFGWLDGRLAVAVPGPNTAVIHRFAPDGASAGSSRAQGSSGPFTRSSSSYSGGGDLVAGHTTLLTVPRGADVRDVADRLARPERDRDVPRLGRDLRRPETVQRRRPRSSLTCPVKRDDVTTKPPYVARLNEPYGIGRCRRREGLRHSTAGMRRPVATRERAPARRRRRRAPGGASRPADHQRPCPSQRSSR